MLNRPQISSFYIRKTLIIKYGFIHITIFILCGRLWWVFIGKRPQEKNHFYRLKYKLLNSQIYLYSNLFK